MNLLSTILDRLNQRIEVGNIFDQIYGLSEAVGEGNDKAWAFYIGNGQAIPVTNFDAKQGTLFWAKRGKITVAKNDSLRLAGCKSIYETRFSMTAYAMVRKSHLPCDSADAQDWVASRVLRLISGTDPQFKTAIGVIAYEVVPNGYQNEIRYLPVNYEWAAVAIDVDVNISTSSEDGCYDTCATGDIPLPDFEPCTPCLTEVAVDGVTITGNGTPSDPLVAIGGGGGGGALIALPFTTDHLSATGNAYAIGNIVWYNGNVYRCIAANDSILPTNTTYWVNLGAGFPTVEQPSDWNATSGNNQILNKPTIPAAQVNSDWNAVSGVAEILNKPTIPVLPATIVEDVTATLPLSSSGGTTPDISISQADTTTDGYLSSADWNTFDGKFDTPTGTSSDYLDGTGTPTTFPTIPSTSGLVPYTGATQDVNLGTHTLSAKDLVINHPSGSGVAASITKGGNGEALTVVKSSGSGNAASITGGVTLIDELHLTTDLADAYIASAATWNAKFNTPSGTTADYVRGDGTIATFPTLPVVYKSAIDTAGYVGNTNTVVFTQLIAANTFAAGDIIRVNYRTRKTGNNGNQVLRVYVNSTPDLVGSPIQISAYNVANNANLYNQILRHMAIKTSTNNTEVVILTSNTNNDYSNFAGVTTCAINWTLARYFVFAIQSTSLTDTNFGSMYSIEKI